MLKLSSPGCRNSTPRHARATKIKIHIPRVRTELITVMFTVKCCQNAFLCIHILFLFSYLFVIFANVYYILNRSIDIDFRIHGEYIFIKVRCNRFNLVNNRPFLIYTESIVQIKYNLINTVCYTN